MAKVVIVSIIKEGDRLLRNTFMHIPGIGKAGETYIWKNQILTWEDFLDKHEDLVLGEDKKNIVFDCVNKSIKACDDGNYYYFLNKIPMSMHWRLYDTLKHKCCFLDIETTGLDKKRNTLTVIGIYDGNESKIFINGINMHEFPAEISKYDMIVTFNGRCFDIPFIQAKFPELSLRKFHVDLRYALKDLGFIGGLKNIEREVGIDRGDELSGVDGMEAVRLWRRYRLMEDMGALELLIKYNEADIENLKILMEFALPRLRGKWLANP